MSSKVELSSNNNNLNTTEAKPLWLSSATFARVDPELYFERHLRQGLRPGTQRGLDDFRAINSQRGSLTCVEEAAGQGSFGSCVVRSGQTSVVCGIVIGTTETRGGGGIYTNVEILRGGFNSAPSGEEMVISQRAGELVRALGLGPSNFAVRVRTPEAEMEEEQAEMEEEEGVGEVREEWERERGIVVKRDRWLVYTAHVQVLSRTGPPFDLVWAAIMGALGDVDIPEFEEDDEGNLFCVGRRTGRKLDLPVGGAVSSTFGVATVDVSKNADVFAEGLPDYDEDENMTSLSSSEEEEKESKPELKVVMLADPDGEIEETCASSRVNVVCNGEGRLYGFSFAAIGDDRLRGQDLNHQGLVLERAHIEQALGLAQERARKDVA
ncbi:uncharacterized protein SAPINGB_P001188 [Magnusiomyces paraingens]|uniref:Ribosomal RNA-processing protein 43 n=1 Tax=Magnusiomyces paraingens TaxID=2606893 RepID=A0A5E8B693_9ASCO|nr:uncharacterized protein SAPINGB_P001188 [Saprochaete ingens]VVT46387.1 unnamed protein product [Saprochaete ingens]